MLDHVELNVVSSVMVASGKIPIAILQNEKVFLVLT